MGSWRARAAAAAGAVAGAAVLFFFGLSIRERVVEEYWIRKLESEEEAEWKPAARKLAVLKSPRAVPHLVRQLEKWYGDEDRMVLVDALRASTRDPALALSDALRGSPTQLRGAIEALGDLGHGGVSAIPA